MSLTLSDLQNYLANHYSDDRDEQGFFIKLVEEVGEVAEVLNKRAKRKSSGDENLQEELGKELADLIHYAVAIATVNQIDLTSVIIEKDRSAALKYQHEVNLETFLSKLHSNL
ncbi:MazG nucleotide pyrophosphohydrolase domain-containing protein [Streptococcus thoraltensis]